MDRVAAGLTFALILTAGAGARAAPTPHSPTSGPRLHGYGDLAITPRGDRVAAVETSTPVESAEKGHGAIVVRSAATGAVLERADPCKTCDYADPAWSPDGAGLAFLAHDGKSGTVSLQLLRGGRTAVLATFKGVANAPRWSPDGGRIAYLAVVGAKKETGATSAGAAQVGEIGAEPDEQRIAVIPAGGGAAKYVSPADTFVYEYDWTPDGRGFVATAAKGDGDNNWWVARLIAVDATGGGVREIAAPSTQANFPRVSPDGRTVAFIGGLMSDFGAVGGDIYTVPFTGGTPMDITPGYKGSFNSIAWRGAGLFATALSGDRMTALSIDPKTGPGRELRSNAATWSAGDGHLVLSSDETVAATVIQDFEHAPHIVAGPLPSMAQITHDNDALTARVSARSFAWKSDGADVQGWLLAPPTLTQGKHPMVVIVHGGPSSAVTPTFLGAGGSFIGKAVRTLLARGYFVFEPNPRGSYGQGEAFTRANVRDLGGGDLRDILAGVDAVEKVEPVDDARLGMFGHSYGGFMTMWTVTHSDRFKAAVAGAGIANWISYYGQNGIDQWMVPFFGGTAYDDPAIYDKLSPIRTIKAAHTPTFIYVGERDVECPPAQSVEFWHGLRAMNVPTSLVVYEGEGHRLRKPANVDDVARRMVDWFERYLR